MAAPFRAFRIRSDADGYRAGVETMANADELTPGEVLVRAAYSSVNYKDALAGTGQGKILRQFPLNGGIDVAGHVVASTDPAFKEGDAVLCTGGGLSETRDGGYGEFVRLEARNTILLPPGLDLRESMVLGTAGFTAALALFRMLQNGQRPESGPIVVTGATGGVGLLASISSRAPVSRSTRSRANPTHRFSGRARREKCIARARTELGPASAGSGALGRCARQRRRRHACRPHPRDQALRQHRQLRHGGRHELGDDGHAFHHPRR